MIVLIMGVCGSGKTTVGKRLAASLKAQFMDADDFHSKKNKAKMESGQALNDADRHVWLEDIASAIQSQSRDTVLACSALKEQYRTRLKTNAEISVVYLNIQKQEAMQRVQLRDSHFFPDSLVDSQYQALEEPTGAIVVDATLPINTIVDKICIAL